MASPISRSDFGPSASWDVLRRRAELLRAVRAFFDEHGFLEVETPLLSADTVVDRHLEPIPVWFDSGSPGTGVSSLDAPQPILPATGAPTASEPPKWLQTSPEFAMKRLLAAGAEAIYQVTRAFRQGETGPLHNPEFTMVEWYRRGDGLDAGMGLLSELCEALLARGPAERITYREAFERFAGVDPFAISNESLSAAVSRIGVTAPEGLATDDRDGWLDLLLVEKVAPRLGRATPTILYDFPSGQAALACIRPDDPPVAERFELFVDGLELANGYHELLDPEELRRRNRATNERRAADGMRILPEESRLLAAMESGLPAASGVALGFDRLVMVATGAKCLAEVIAFPIDRA